MRLQDFNKFRDFQHYLPKRLPGARAWGSTPVVRHSVRLLTAPRTVCTQTNAECNINFDYFFVGTISTPPITTGLEITRTRSNFSASSAILRGIPERLMAITRQAR